MLAPTFVSNILQTNSKGLLFQAHTGSVELGLLSASFVVITQVIVETLA